ncbi:MAG: hypothetical protein ABI629_11925 [bacterium]
MSSRLLEIERLHLGLLVAVVCAALVTGWFAPLSVLLGGIVMGVNLRLLAALTARLLAPGATRRPGVVVALVLAKFGLYIGLIGMLLWRLPIEPMAFAAGTTLLLIASVISSLRAAPVVALS